MGEALIKAISELEEDEALRLVKTALDLGENPSSILSDCQVAMKTVGDRFEKGEYYLPELIMSGHVLEKISEVIKPRLDAQSSGKVVNHKKGKVVLGTVRGDVHNIGKDIVKFLLDVNGFEVLDLGVDVPEERFVQAIREDKPQVIGLSGLLTSAYDSMLSTVKAIDEAKLRDKVRIMIGGGQMDQAIADHVGADAYGKDAMSAVTLAEGWIEK
jgi:trimethylamine corrinoid protein